MTGMTISGSRRKWRWLMRTRSVVKRKISPVILFGGGSEILKALVFAEEPVNLREPFEISSLTDTNIMDVFLISRMALEQEIPSI